RRSPAAYAPLIAGEAALPQGEMPELVVFGRFTGDSPAAAAVQSMPHQMLSPEMVTALALRSRETRIDAGGLVPDLAHTNSWVQVVDEVDPIGLLEVQLCNMTAPFILVSRLRPALAKSSARRKYVVNVSAMEGQFGRGYKGPGHPHTNMAKAALNMLT